MAGCIWLGFAYQNGWGTAVDAVKAADLFRKACDGGEATGCRIVGSLYRNGLGVPVDESTALSFYHKACDGGDKAACTDMKAEP